MRERVDRVERRGAGRSRRWHGESGRSSWLAIFVAASAAGTLLAGCFGAMAPHGPGYDRGGASLVAAPAAEASGTTATAARQRQPARAPAGVLTAGSFDDARTPWVLDRFLAQLGQSEVGGPWPAKLSGPRRIVTVRDRLGRPVAGARVELLETGRVLVTRAAGQVMVGSSWDRVSGDRPIRLAVTPPGGRRVEATLGWAGPAAVVVDAPAAAPLPRRLDLALVVDVTGSMADELRYLHAEIRSIADAVRRRYPHVSQRYALCVYRDRGDSFVTRSYDFTPDLGDFHDAIEAQTAGGGGDYPEAMDRALQDAARLEWREGADTARVLFLVADAPPHRGDLEAAGRQVEALRELGVGIYPVAASGVATEAELVMRGAAAMTLGQYLFLTDDSGVGNAHAEPHLPFYRVERLNGLMARMIASELAGRRLAAETDEIIRTVGDPGALLREPGPLQVSARPGGF